MLPAGVIGPRAEPQPPTMRCVTPLQPAGRGCCSPEDRAIRARVLKLCNTLAPHVIIDGRWRTLHEQAVPCRETQEGPEDAGPVLRAREWLFEQPPDRRGGDEAQAL